MDAIFQCCVEETAEEEFFADGDQGKEADQEDQVNRRAARQDVEFCVSVGAIVNSEQILEGQGDGDCDEHDYQIDSEGDEYCFEDCHGRAEFYLRSDFSFFEDAEGVNQHGYGKCETDEYDNPIHCLRAERVFKEEGEYKHYANNRNGNEAAGDDVGPGPGRSDRFLSMRQDSVRV